MEREKLVAAYYSRGTVLAAIEAGLAAEGKSLDHLTIEDLAPVDEFHVGGRAATTAFLDRLDLAANGQALDVGCGIGGAARLAASLHGCHVDGIDLTEEYVDTGNALSARLGLRDRVELHHGSASAMPFDRDSHDVAFMLHVGMNIADKRSLFGEVARVLRPGARFGIYDVMRTSGGNVAYPVPWAADASTCALASPEAYRGALTEAGFEIIAERNLRDLCITFFEKLTARLAEAEGLPPLGLHLLMGAESTPAKLGNMLENARSGILAPVEIIARLRPNPAARSVDAQ